MAENPCGGCTACCRVMGVEELEKPRGTFCTHAPPGAKSCSIYEDRPLSCRSFECLWLTSQAVEAARMPEALRPDRSRVVVTCDAQAMVFHVMPAYADAWKREEFLGPARRAAKLGVRVFVAVGSVLRELDPSNP